MKRLALNLASLFLLGVFLLFASATTGGTDSGSSGGAATSADPSFTVTANELYAEYEENEIASNEKYEGEVFTVTGTVENIGTDIVDNPYLTLETRGAIFSVQCFFSDRSQLAEISPGERVRVTGRGDGTAGNIILRECAFAE